MILMNDFKAEQKALRETMLASTSRVIDSGWFILGKEVEDFERSWADMCGSKYAVAVGNGMDAIEIAMRSMGIGQDDEVITTSMTAFATVLAIVRAGAKPVLADIDRESALISLASVERCLTSNTKALLLVHLYGQMRQMDKWQQFCKEKGIYLIEDCAQAHLATWQGKKAGTYGEAGAYSFYPTKNLGALGDGGALIISKSEYAERALRIRNYGQSSRYHHTEYGMNSRLDEIQAAILLEKLKLLPEYTERRQVIGKKYRESIDNSLIRPLAKPEEQSAHVYHLCVYTCNHRDDLMNHLKNCGVESLIHYPVPIHKQPPCINLPRDPCGLEESERHADSCFSIPCHPYMSDEDINDVIVAMNSYKGN